MNKETLSDKEIEADNKKKDNGFYWSKDVKEAIKKLNIKLHNLSFDFFRDELAYKSYCIARKKIINEIFGEELTK